MHSSFISMFKRQRGAAAVEFSIIALLFFTILFAIFEFGRMLYIYNTMQEVSRRAAREAVVRWIDAGDTIKSLALFGGAHIPAGAEVAASNINIQYLNKNAVPATPTPADPGDNLSACNDITRTDSCIVGVRVSIDNVRYRPMVNLFGFLSIDLPTAGITMPAESLGFTVN